MPLPYSYKRNCSKKIYSKKEFATNLKKLLNEPKDFNFQNDKITFTLDKALIPFNYEVCISFDTENRLSYKINLTNLFLINFIVILLLLFVIKNFIVLMLVWLVIMIITYAINIFHINTYLEYYLEIANKKPQKICPNCKSEVDEDLEICPVCGFPFNNSTTDGISFQYIIKN